MASANLDLVRAICADWERGDFGSSEWATPEIELVHADGPLRGSWRGRAAMARTHREFLSAWEEVRYVAEQYRRLDDERVLVLFQLSGRGKASGVEAARMRTSCASLFHVKAGKVTRLVNYFERERALADLGLDAEASDRVTDEVSAGWTAAWVNADREAFLELFHPGIELYLPRSALEGTVYRGLEGADRAFSDGFEAWERLEIVEPVTIVRSLGDWYLAKGRPRLHPRGPGPAVEYDAWWLFRVDAGKIAYAHPYQDDRVALAAFEARVS